MTLSEWQREARDRVCPYCGGGLAAIDGPEGPWLACNDGHEMLSPLDCPHYQDLARLEGEALVTTGRVRDYGRSVVDCMDDLYGGR